MVELSKAERLAELKSVMKALEEEAKGLQKELIEGGAPEKMKTSYGTLHLGTRTTYGCPDKEKMFETIGKDEYIVSSSISYSGVKNRLGELRIKMLEAEGLFKISSVSQYYTLRK